MPLGGPVVQNEQPIVGLSKPERPKAVKLAKLIEPKAVILPPKPERPKPSQSGKRDVKRISKKGEGPAKSFAEIGEMFSKEYASGVELDFLKTGSISLDHILGGGMPRGRIIELHSPSGLGKSTTSIHICNHLCDLGLNVLYLDVEKAINESLLDGIGITHHKDKKFFIHKPTTFSEVETLIDGYADTADGVDFIVIDSITACVPHKMAYGDLKIEDVEPGLQSRLQANFFLKYKSVVSNRNMCMLLINQMRVKINMRGGPSVSQGAGGEAMKFWPDIRIKCIKSGEIMENGEIIGTDLFIETIKNKVTKPFVRNILSVYFGKGISNLRACTHLLQAEGVVTQSGSSFKIDVPGLPGLSVRGRVGLEGWIKDNEEDVFAYLKSKGRA